MVLYSNIYCVFAGGHGGRGGSPANTFLTRSDAVAYGSFIRPLHPGSQGGGSNGGEGGGALLLNVTGDIDINGILSADGGDASGTFGGGGSGGSIFIDADAIRGSGVISARGGRGIGNGGGGGGGRITFKYVSLASTAQIFADGGLSGKHVHRHAHMCNNPSYSQHPHISSH